MNIMREFKLLKEKVLLKKKSGLLTADEATVMKQERKIYMIIVDAFYFSVTVELAVLDEASC